MNDLDVWANSPLWDNEVSRNTYSIPLRLSLLQAYREGRKLAVGIPKSELYTIGRYRCAQSPQTHKAANRHAIDFLVPDGSYVYAAAPGMITEVEERSNTWGDGEAFRDTLNYLTIVHENGEFTQYCHLAQNSVTLMNLKKGSYVECGQKIGVVGKTGHTDRDHLHFIVFRGDVNPSPFQFKSLVPQWH